MTKKQLSQLRESQFEHFGSSSLENIDLKKRAPMSNEEIKTLVEQEAEKYAFNLTLQAASLDPKVRNARLHAFAAGATFYEQSILPEVLKEKDEMINELSDDLLKEQHEWSTLLLKYSTVNEQLSQLQSKMEERERKVFEAARRGVSIGALIEDEVVFNNYEDYLKSTTQSTESQTNKQ